MDVGANLTEHDLIERCSRGDGRSHSAMALRCVVNESGLTPVEALTYAETFARLAAAQGGVDERLMLAAVLRGRAYQVLNVGKVERFEHLLEHSTALCGDFAGAHLSGATEFLAGILSAAADEGDEEAGLLLGKLMTALTADEADDLRSRLNAAAKELKAARDFPELAIHRL